jgi:hypothetical protein
MTRRKTSEGLIKDIKQKILSMMILGFQRGLMSN